MSNRGDRMDRRLTIMIAMMFVVVAFGSAMTYDMDQDAASSEYATSVEIGTSKTAGGIKVTIMGVDDLKVPSGELIVSYYYWDTVLGARSIITAEKTVTVEGEKIVNSVNVSFDRIPAYYVASFLSDSGTVKGETPIILY